MLYRWREIRRAPLEAGVYAWYMSPEITTFDLETTIDNVKVAREEGRDSDAVESVRQLLDQALFRYLREDPYTARLSGPLKPTFVGQLTHESAISPSLLKRIVENPERLRVIKRIVESSAPSFSSPLYIGMASNLRTRLLRHRTLIEAPSESRRIFVEDGDSDPEVQQLFRDRSFAERIQTRKIPPSRLFVVTEIVDGDDGTFLDIENLLNRLHFPLLGRN